MTFLNRQEDHAIGLLDRKLADERAARLRIAREAKRARDAKAHAETFEGQEPLENMRALRRASQDRIGVLRPEGPIPVKSAREASHVEAERLFANRECEAA